MFKFILKPLSIFSYHYFFEGIKGIKKDGATKEIESIPNLSYDEITQIMEKCQKDGVRVLASQRKLSTNEGEIGKTKSLFSQRRMTKLARRIRQMDKFKTDYPKVAKFLKLDRIMNIYKTKQHTQIEYHKNNHYDIFFNKSKIGYMGKRTEEIIMSRTNFSKELFDENTRKTIEQIKKEEMSLNTQKLKDLSQKFNLQDINSIPNDNLKRYYCVHEIPFSFFTKIEESLEKSSIPYKMKTITNDDKEMVVDIFFESKYLEKYSDLKINEEGKIYVHGNKQRRQDIKNNEIIEFKTKTGEEEKKVHTILLGKNYVMSKKNNECFWSILKTDLEEIAEMEKKRDVVNEQIEKLHIFEQIEKQPSNNTKEVEIELLEEVGE